MPLLPKKWKVTTPKNERRLAKRVEILTDTPSGVRVWVDSDDVIPGDVAKVVGAIARLPRLLEIERLVLGQFTEGSRHPYPTSDRDPDCLLRNLTGWKRKATR